MKKLVIIDDDPKLRSLIRVRLQSTYELFDTGDPAEAFRLVLTNKPDAILLDLLMPGHTGFELCQSLHSFSFTSKIPIFILTGEYGSRFREHCKSLGASGYFEKPIDFPALIRAIECAVPSYRVERRAHLRVAMKVVLKLVARGENNKFKSEIVTTENVSAGGFLCACTTPLRKDDVVEVYLDGDEGRYAGKARVARKEVSSTHWQNYGFQLIEKTQDWLLQ